MENRNTKIAISVLVILALILIGFYTYRTNKTPETDTQTSTSTDVIASTSISTDISSVDVLGVEEIPTSIPVGAKIPSLDSTVTYSASLTPEAKTIITKKISDRRALLKKEPGMSSNWLQLGVEYKIAGDYQKAKEAWEFSALLSPKAIAPFFNLGDLNHYYLKNIEEAEKNILIAIKNGPSYVPAYQALGELYAYSMTSKKASFPGIVEKAIQQNTDAKVKAGLEKVLADFKNL